MEDRKIRIWYQTLDEDGKVIGTGVYHKAYVHMGTAANVAFKQFGGNPRIKYRIAPLNPFETNIDSMVCDICGKSFEVTMDSWGHKNCDTLSICSWSGSIPPDNGRKHFSRYCHTCSDCTVKIKNFVDSLKEGKDGSPKIKNEETCRTCAYMVHSGSTCRKYTWCQDGCDNYDPKTDMLQQCRCQQIPTGEPCPYYKPNT